MPRRTSAAARAMPPAPAKCRRTPSPPKASLSGSVHCVTGREHLDSGENTPADVSERVEHTACTGSRVTGQKTASRPRQIATSIWLPAALLFGSGFCALVYQVLWLRLLGLVFGVTVHAAGTVLTAFMGGLAIGSFVAGRLADRVTAPLRWFAVAELLIGAAAVCTPWLLGVLEVLYRQVYSSVSDDAGVLTAVRFAGSLAALLVPTTLMGASIPLAIRASVGRAADFGTRAAALYAANAAGALTGALITGYYLVSQLGITASLRLAAVINVVVGAIAWAWPTRPTADAAVTTHGVDATAR